MKKYIAEFIGTFTLVLFGCGSAVIANSFPMPDGKTMAGVGLLGISFAFGFALIGMAYSIGHVSGCHINPAVSLGVFIAGRMTSKDFGGYVIAQILGGFAGAGALALIAPGKGFGANGFGEGYLGQYSMVSAIAFEFIATLLFIIVILGSTQKGVNSDFAGLIIGITLVVIHIVGIPVTGVSVNPARSLGPAIFAGGSSISQVWVFLVFPMLAGAAAGFLYKDDGILAKDQP
ncbi:MAG TPA: aquaporin [Allocoleopsis sp.]